MATPAARVDTNYTDYTDAGQTHSYSHNLGYVAVPLAQRDPGHKIIRLHGGIAIRTTEWNYSRSGRPPIIPVAQDTSGDTLLGTIVAPSLPIPDPVSGGYNWNVRGSYSYVQNTPRVAGTDPFPVGNYPFLVLPQMNIAGRIASAVISAYTGANAWADFIEAAADSMTFSDGTYSWPFLGLPTVFSSTHLIQD